MPPANAPAASGPGDVVAASPVRARRAGGRGARRSRPWTWWTWCLVVGAFVAAFPVVMILCFPGGSCGGGHSSRPQVDAQLRQLRRAIESWETRFGALPPSRLSAGTAERPEATPFRVQPPNSINEGIEALYLALDRAELLPPKSASLATNTDGDVIAGGEGEPPLLEFSDPWDNPYVYFVAADYAAALRNPPTYVTASGEGVTPRPQLDPAGAVRRPASYQLFSMGSDGEPNTDDDISVDDISGADPTDRTSMPSGCGG